MLGGKKRNAGVALAKVYGSAPPNDWRGAISRLVGDAATWLAAAPYGFSVNYGEARKFDTGALERRIGSSDGIEYLDLLSKSQNAGLFVTTPFLRVLPRPLYECCFFRSGDVEREEFFLDVVRLVDRHLRVVYGYGRELPLEADALSETVPRRTLFGNSVLKTDPELHVWKSGPTLDGGLKGLYQFNLVPGSMLRDNALLGSIVQELPPDRIRTIDRSLSAMILSGADLRRVREKAPDLKDFVRS
jgi:hypothetical protein